MNPAAANTRVLLVGGTSHVGKSTLARQLADKLGWQLRSTDQLARHPGRPWRNDHTELPDDVIEHYSQRSTTRLLDQVLAHYRLNVWPIVAAIVRSHLNNPYDPCLIFEGSAVLPEQVAAAGFEHVTAVWLTAPPELIRARILDDSRHADRSAAEQRLIEAFLERTLAFARTLELSAVQHGWQPLDTTSEDTLTVMTASCRR